MRQFSSEDSMPRTWLLLTFGEQRKYAGNLGYIDKLSKVYQYDSFVQNHRQITEGDLALLQGRDKLLGVARIERIDACEGTKKRLRCPVCGATKLNRRKVLSPEFHCYKGNHEFDTPVEEVVACMLFTAHFGDSFVPAEKRSA